MGFEIDVKSIQQHCKNGLNTVHQFASTWYNKGVEWVNIGVNKAPPHIQKNQYVILAVTFCACLIIVDLSTRLGCLVSKVVPENRKATRQAVDSAVTLITITGFLWKFSQFIRRSNLPITWFSGSICLLTAVVIRGYKEA